MTASDDFLKAVSSFTLTMEPWSARVLPDILFRILEKWSIGFNAAFSNQVCVDHISPC